jgi:hypothetical protein
MASYVTLTTALRDTVPVRDFVLQRTYGLGHSTDLLFAFNKEKASDAKWVEFNLKEFGMNMGYQRFRFKVKELEEVPQINFEKISGKPD